MLKPFHLARLREIVQRCVPFINHDGQIFVSMPEPRGLTLPLRSTEFRNWFVYKAVAHYETFPTPNAMNAIFNHLEALAGELPNGSPSVFRRVGFRSQDYLPTRILIDLANSQCQYVVIAPTGWKIDSGKQEYFETSRSTRPLPYPAPAASPAPASEPPINCQPPFPNEPAAEAAAATPTDPQSLTPNPQPPILRPPTPALDALRALLNLPSRPAFLRVLAWLLAALRPTGPFPFLVLQGPPGSGKTFAAKILRSIFDPSTAPLSPIPATPRDLYILARHNWILALDHVSTLLWKGSATELFDLLQPGVSCQNPASAAKQLRSCSLTLADHGIELKFRRLHGGARVVEIHDDPGDGSSPENPPQPSPDSDTPPQPTETEEVKS